MLQVAMTMNHLNELRQKRGGFVTDTEVAAIANSWPHCLLLVRTSQGRFTCAASCAAHYIAMVEAHPTDYLRDVCFPVGK